MITINEARKLMPNEYQDILDEHERIIDEKIKKAAKSGIYWIRYNSKSQVINEELAKMYREAGFKVYEYYSPNNEIEINW